ncbi:hypothetical protein GCM10023208_19040 [Erythrobacter westpacificensis]|uniref:Uncharacterized protein n=1 Tax=Erythrobacter westpacificensis TaxID=1055231 RepID=A0ABP9KC32_9SPHN
MTDFRENWPEMRMKHLELVQNAITRMGSNSANLKGYCMGVVAALIALAGAIDKPKVLFLGLPIVLAFSILDAAYLSLEKGFRNHYDTLRVEPLDRPPNFEVTATGEGNFLKAYKSWSVWAFYLGSAAILVLVGLVL